MLLTNNAENGSNNTQLTPANSGFDIVSNGSTGSTVFTSSAINGGLSYRTTAGTGNTYVGYSTALGGNKTELWVRLYARVSSYYAGGLALIRQSGGLAGKTGITETGKFNVSNSLNQFIQTSASTVPLNATFRVEMHIVASSGPTSADGKIEVRIFNNPTSTTPTETLGPFTTQTTTDFDQVWFGPVGGGNTGGVLTYDDVAVSDTGWIGPLSTPTLQAAGWGIVGRPQTVTPPQPSPSSMLLGVNSVYFDELQSKLHNINPAATMQTRRWYIPGNIPASWSSSPGRVDSDAGRIGSWGSANGPSVSVINSGTYDSTLDSFFASIPPNMKVMFTWKHEVDARQDAKLEGSTRAQYRTAVARIHARKQASAQNPANVSVGVILTGTPFRSGSAGDYFPTNGGVDFIGGDPYRFWRPPGSPNDPKCNGLCTSRTMQYLLGDGMAHDNGMPQLAERLGVPIALGEYGAHPFPDDPQNRPNWLNETHAYLESLSCGVMAACYFHSHHGESGPWFVDRYHTFVNPENNPDRLNGAPDPHSLNAYAALVAAANA